MEKRRIYKSEDAETIFEYLKKLEEETEETVRFINALKRELVRGYNAQERLRKMEKEEKERKQDSSWDSISK